VASATSNQHHNREYSGNKQLILKAPVL